MMDDRFDDLMKDAAATYNRPPDVVPLDEMWSSIERRSFAPDVARDLALAPARARDVWRTRAYRALQAAALIVLGFGIGRATSDRWPLAPPASIAAGNEINAVPYEYTPVTDRYLGQAAKLLIDLPRELRLRPADSNFVGGARDLLLHTRLLLDSPAIQDPALRTLLEDLEVVLIQLVRLQADPDPMKLDLLQESLEQSEVIPRLRSAVADYITD